MVAPQSEGGAREEEEGGLLSRASELLLSREEVKSWQAVASSMKDCMVHVGPWSLGDFAFGLCATPTHNCPCPSCLSADPPLYIYHWHVLFWIH